MLSNTITYLIVGLGNPDKQYQQTFHNIGFMCVDAYAKKLGIEFSKGECRAITASIKSGSTKIIIAKPITYMNLSGEAIRELVNKYKIEQDKLLVVYDDVDIPLASVRIRCKGSGGTHNGMKNVVACLNTQDIYRIRVGIGQTHEGELFDYVLSKISKADLKLLDQAITSVVSALEFFCSGQQIDKVMLQFNHINDTL
ncbi:MAG: aminoacyl-tRNA hydrolase [Clostridia bacterium]